MQLNEVDGVFVGTISEDLLLECSSVVFFLSYLVMDGDNWDTKRDFTFPSSFNLELIVGIIN